MLKIMMEKVCKKYLVNIIALSGLCVGLLNTILIWAIYGSTSNADVLMLSFVMFQSFSLLSQLGVEQFSIFSAEERAKSINLGLEFDFGVIVWSLIFGAIFSCALIYFLPWLVNLYAKGFSAEEQKKLFETVMPLAISTAFSPFLYVIRQKMFLDGRVKLASALNGLFSYIQFFVLTSVFFMFRGSGTITISWCISICFFVLSFFLLSVNLKSVALLKRTNYSKLRSFVVASVKLRLTSSIHNFFSVLLTNSALSFGYSGTVATYQYIKKFADGVSSISAGPHLQIYHANQSIVWAKSDKNAFLANIKKYIDQIVPIFIIGALSFMFLVYILSLLLDGIESEIPNNGYCIFLILLLWQLIISVETIAVGVLVMQKKHFFLVDGELCFFAEFLFP